MLLDVRPDHLEIIQAILRKHIPDREVWAFGSRTKWTARDVSDLDLAIIGDVPLEFKTLAALRDAFSESNLPYKVDVVDWATTSGEFRKIIEAQRVLVQALNKHVVEKKESEHTCQQKSAPNWKKHLIRDLINEGILSIGDGYRAKNTELSARGIPFARAGNIDGGFQFDNADYFPLENLWRVGDKLSRAGDVVFTSKGTVGRFAYVKPETQQFVYSPQLCYWRSHDPNIIDPRFLYFWMSGPEFWEQTRRVKSQTDMADYVSLSDQRNMAITLPQIHQQRVIANILGTLEEKNNLNRQINTKLEAMSRAIFKSCFVDFDPVYAKVEGRCLFGMDGNTVALFPDSFKDSLQGDIPADWQDTTLEEIVTERTSKVGTTNGHVVLSAVSSGVLKRSDDYFTKQVYSQDTAKYKMVEQWDYAYNPSRINIGSIGMLEEPVTGAVSPVYVVFRPAQGYEWFLRFFLDLPQTREVINQLCSGSVRQSISFKDFASIPVVLPPKPIAEAFSRRWQELNALRQKLESQSRKLSEVRGTLLPRLMSGDLRVLNLKGSEAA